jgi:hypothetical protein
MTFMMLGCTLELFSRHLLQIFRLQAASSYGPISARGGSASGRAFAPEGLSLDRLASE